MANHSIDLGVKSQQQIAAVAAILGGITAAVFAYDSGQNIWIGMFVGMALSFVLSLISRWLGVLICLGGGLVLLGYFADQ